MNQDLNFHFVAYIVQSLFSFIFKLKKNSKKKIFFFLFLKQKNKLLTYYLSNFFFSFFRNLAEWTKPDNCILERMNYGKFVSFFFFLFYLGNVIKIFFFFFNNLS